MRDERAKALRADSVGGSPGAGRAMLSSLRAVRRRGRRAPSRVLGRAGPPAPSPGTGAARWICPAVTLGELARGRHDRLLFRDRLDDVVLAVLDVEDEL